MKKLTFIIIVLTSVLTGCENDLNNGSARLKFSLTDAPASYDKVLIDIIGAQAIINDSTIDLDVKTGIYNLLDFTNGKDTIIVDQEIPEGKLTQIRLLLGDNNSVVMGNNTYNMKTPSAQQSGLKLNVQAVFLEGISYEYTIDFDAARSIVRTGNDKFILKPVIKVFTKSVSGSIKGVVKPADAKPVIYAITGQLDSISTYADATSGNFMFMGLKSGNYKLSFEPVSPYKDTSLVNIKVITGQVTSLDTMKFKQ
jgi:hypothetical protein